MQPHIKCLLWDFGDTLCDEKFIWNSGPEWMEVYATFDDDGIGAQWSLGEIDTRDFAQSLSERMGLTTEFIISHMTARCHNINFFEQTYAFFKARHLPQAIVTVNPDIFSEVIVPICAFDRDCDAIVTSWQEHTIDKRILNRLAIERLGIQCANSEALLLDNKQSNITDWCAIGGSGYLYKDDVSFAKDAALGINALAARFDVS